MDTKTLHKISYGLYVICSRKSQQLNGQIANTLFQITSEPPSLAVSINKQNLTHQFIKDSNAFTASILDQETPLKFIGHFGFRSGKDIDKFQDINYKTGISGCPIVLDHSLGYLEVEVFNSLDAGTHTIFLGKLVGAEISSNNEPMTYAYYQEVKKGKAPKTAPTYLKE